MTQLFLLSIVILAMCANAFTQFVSTKGHQLQLNNKLYYFVGTNYWYGSLLGLEKDRRRGVDRLRKELDFLKRHGVTNLRLMAGAEGSGMLNGVMRVGPALQPSEGKFDESVLDGLDLVLAEMAKRDMKAVIFFSNNWEWSGGWQQYLIWSGFESNDLLHEKPEWEELRYWVARFYICGPCMDAYNKQVDLILGRTNTITRQKYIADPTIMAWELANEPRPMRPSSNEPYKHWIRETAARIKARDKRHLVTIGHEGSIGTESIELFEEIHRDPNIDYLTIHIWAKNWQWYTGNNFAEAFPKAEKYIEDHIAVARRLNKPLVIEEFGLPRDVVVRDAVRGRRGDAGRGRRGEAGPGEGEKGRGGEGGRKAIQNPKSKIQNLLPGSPTTLRDRYYRRIFSYIGGPVAGANFWAFGGTARPIRGQDFWKPGDEYMGDPPMEEQGLNTVFDVDRTTWRVISSAALRARRQR